MVGWIAGAVVAGVGVEVEMSASWRMRARPIVAQVLHDTKGKPEAEIKKALFDAYPFGMRQYTPYKIWLDEIKRQRGTWKDPRRNAEQLKLREWEELYGKRAE
jgi:hypothetical protein